MPSNPLPTTELPRTEIDVEFTMTRPSNDTLATVLPSPGPVPPKRMSPEPFEYTAWPTAAAPLDPSSPKMLPVIAVPEPDDVCAIAAFGRWANRLPVTTVPLVVSETAMPSPGAPVEVVPSASRPKVLPSTTVFVADCVTSTPSSVPAAAKRLPGCAWAADPHAVRRAVDHDVAGRVARSGSGDGEAEPAGLHRRAVRPRDQRVARPGRDGEPAYGDVARLHVDAEAGDERGAVRGR